MGDISRWNLPIRALERDGHERDSAVGRNRLKVQIRCDFRSISLGSGIEL